MSDERLLTEDEIIDAHNLWCRRSQDQLKISWRQWQNQAQDAKTRAETLKEVGLEYDEDGELINWPNKETWEALKQGKLSEG